MMWEKKSKPMLWKDVRIISMNILSLNEPIKVEEWINHVSSATFDLCVNNLEGSQPQTEKENLFSYNLYLFIDLNWTSYLNINSLL